MTDLAGNRLATSAAAIAATSEWMITLVGVIAFSIGAVDIGTVLGLLQLEFGLGYMLSNIGPALSALTEATEAGSRALEVMRLPVESQDTTPARRSRRLSVESGIVLSDVSFSYAAGRPLLRGIDLDLVTGKIVVVRGENGSGKSTLLKLLLGLRLPDSGCVKVDGVPVCADNLFTLRHRCSYAPQRDAIFDVGVLDNVICDGEDASLTLNDGDSGLPGMLQMLGIGEPQLKHSVGPSGAQLSSGQRKRIGLARALTRKVPFLVLDEPYNYLDAPAREWLTSALLAERRGNRGILVVTHDVALLGMADEQLVLSAGELVRV